MDPATVAGLAFGAGSLALDVFDRSVKLFKFFASLVDMPKEYERYRFQFLIEYNRLLAWGDAVGLVRVASGSDLASSLGTNAMELCAIVARIGGLLEEFRDYDDRWKSEMVADPASGPGVATDMSQVDLGSQISALMISYEKDREERKRLTGLHRVVQRTKRGMGSAKELIAHPSRIRWVMVDKEAFTELLQQLHGLIERIHELISDYQGRQIHETTAKTYRELVVVRSDLSELKCMFQALIDLMDVARNSCSGDTSRQDENNKTLRELLLLKEMKLISDEILSKMERNPEMTTGELLGDVLKVHQFDGNSFRNSFMPDEAVTTNVGHDPKRPRGRLIADEKSYEVWVEWRQVEPGTHTLREDKESVLRTATLAQMLSITKPPHLLSPTCIGYVDDRKGRSQIGWIFEMPCGSQRGAHLRTLHSILGFRQHRPTFNQRISLAWKLASSLLYLHTVDWLHKGIHSGNVVFSFDHGRFDFDTPILSGFEYSRPQINKTTSRSLDPKWDIYRWPSIQSEAPNAENSRKTYDIYSLGLLLIEIAHWQPLHKLMSLQKWPRSSTQDCRIRGWLLDEELFPPFKNDNPLLELRNISGDQYWEATRCCLVAHGEHGLRIPEDTDQSGPEVGLKLQMTFTELVVERLKAVSV